jgi:hypothetical protein
MGLWARLPGRPNLVWQANVADDWAWSLLVVSREP